MIGKIGLLGGSFDPVHHGHLIAARSIAETLKLDRVVLLPSGNPPHKLHNWMTSAAHRAAMVRLAIESDDLFHISDYDMTCGGPSYTVNTVRHFHEITPDRTELFWIIGSDSLLEFHNWYKPAEIAGTCRIVTAARPGFEPGDLKRLKRLLEPSAFKQLRGDIIETPRIDISATDIRRRVSEGKTIRYLTPDAVIAYVREHSLYVPAAQERD